MHDTVYPLLHGARALTIAVGVSLRTHDLDPDRASWALVLIEGQLESALHILQRWEETQDRASGAEDDDEERVTQPLDERPWQGDTRGPHSSEGARSSLPDAFFHPIP